ncbi:GNAT family N-acetyltransferase [Rossellomorea aquimaris]|uniref:GNAT family N-acetyltransferase n=1 Tax=Rossellomorea aquimaris TaxID=189382 RepID=UPI001CD5997D|nr:GNAT family N-acetyltransferase [Rossellomorea aquimaris]MCA1054088.1 GNAT family N-acetyltransferase [Rossellomorea aquimaris]
MNKPSLVNMTETEFEHYFQDKVARYAAVLAQNALEDSLDFNQKAKEQLHNLLPDGIHTPNHHLLFINHDDHHVGYIWLKEQQDTKSAFLYEIYLFEEFRNKGIGSVAMNSVEEWMKEQELLFLKLHVFGSNTGALKLYEKIGFEVAGINMMKRV